MTSKDSSPSPRWLLEIFSDFFDPCPLNDNPKINGLEIPWKKKNYVNPPYSNKIPWIKKAIEEQEKGNTTVMLLPFDTSAIWFFELVVPNAIILGFRGRLKLDNGKHPMYGNLLAIFNPRTF
jgi:hypothetical protein